MSLRSNPVRSGGPVPVGPVLVGPVLVGLVPVGLVPVGLVPVGLVLVSPVPVGLVDLRWIYVGSTGFTSGLRRIYVEFTSELRKTDVKST